MGVENGMPDAYRSGPRIPYEQWLAEEPVIEWEPGIVRRSGVGGSREARKSARIAPGGSVAVRAAYPHIQPPETDDTLPY